jgi:hypothetical protein
MFKGGTFIKELAVTEFAPFRGLPHYHCLIHGSDWERFLGGFYDMATSSKVWKLLTSLYNSRLPNGFKPSLQMLPSPTADELRSFLYYAQKPLTVYEPYQRAWERIAVRDKHMLNREVSQFIDDFRYQLPSRDMTFFMTIS